MNRITITAVVATVAACISLGSPASAQEEDDGASSASTASPYATPLEALGGRTLAQYLADHQDRRTACCTW